MSVRSARKHDGALSECVRRGQRVSTTRAVRVLDGEYINTSNEYGGDVKTSFWLRPQRGNKKRFR